MRGLSGKVRPRGRVLGTQPRGVPGMVKRDAAHPQEGWWGGRESAVSRAGLGGGDSVWASLGQAQN